MHNPPVTPHLPVCKTCLRWLVLMVLIWGTLVSSLGLLTSHGLAGLAVADHGVAFGDVDGHAHGDKAQVADPVSGHPHHSADHSHDKAHALPAQLTVAPAASPEPIAVALPWAPWLEADRLDRPPRS